LEQRIEALPFVEKKLARFVTQTDTKPLIAILSKTFAPNIKYLFGISVLLISFSTIVILMILNGHLVCEVLGKPHKGAPFQSGSMILALSSVGPFVLSDQNNWVADPSYFLSLAILPFALLSFILMLNSKELLGRQRPKGFNGLMNNAGSLIAFLSLGATSFYLVWNHTWKNVPIGQFLVVLLGILILVGYFTLKNKKLSNRLAGLEARFESLKK
jgi:amino acid permease